MDDPFFGIKDFNKVDDFCVRTDVLFVRGWLQVNYAVTASEEENLLERSRRTERDKQGYYSSLKLSYKLQADFNLI